MFLFLLLALDVTSAAKKAADAAQTSAVIEEVTTKQLERILNEKDFVAVYWCKCVLFDMKIKRNEKKVSLVYV